jgi:hypothetical protein
VTSAVRDKTKTWIGRRIEGALTSLNDQFSFLLFLEHEFVEQVQSFGPAVANHFTTDVFSRNPNAARIHVRLRELRTFIEANRGVSFGAYFTASYEVTAPFFDEALDVLRRANGPSLRLPRRHREGPEQFYERALSDWGYSLPVGDLLKTMSWIRYRRNGLVHLDYSLGTPYAALAAQSGKALNSFWRKTGVQLDFSLPTTGFLAERDTLDLIKIRAFWFVD